MEFGIAQLAIGIVLSAILAVVARMFRQPTILAYLVAGAILGSLKLFDISGGESWGLFSDLGIMFLLFLVGLDINYSTLKIIGRWAVFLGLMQMSATILFGWLLAALLGFGFASAFFIALALTFSSTIIVVKLLTDKKDLNSLYGKISLGILLVQDAVAILVLILLAGTSNGSGTMVLDLFLALVKGFVLFLVTFLLGHYVFPVLFKKIAHSQELLFLTSLAWVFLMASLSIKIGLSVEIGGFLAGLALANSAEHFQISNRFRTLRDFFILLFFVMLGSLLVLSHIERIILPVIVLSVFVLIGKPLIVMLSMRFAGFRKRTNFQTGLSLAQVSEFSLVLVALAMGAGRIEESVGAIVTAVAVVTIIVSSYFILNGQFLYLRFSRWLNIFERKSELKGARAKKDLCKPIVLIGYNRTGQSIASALKKQDLLVIDFDPDMVAHLSRQKYDYIFGDISDDEVVQLSNLHRSKLVISTSPDLHDNLSLLNVFKNNRRRPKFIIRAETQAESEQLYEAGADYVLLPHISSGHYLGHLLAEDKKFKFLQLLKKRDQSVYLK